MNGETKKKKTGNDPKGVSGTVYMLCHDLLYVLAIITVVFVFFARLTGVNGSSMYPTLMGENESAGTRGDLLVLESNVLNTDYHQGEIVVAVVPSFDSTRPIVKRVIATAGQTVDMHYDEDGKYHVFVDGVALDEPYINGEMQQTLYQTLEFPATVPENCFFLMGDNRNNSNDSRNPSIGMVNRQYIVGRAMLLLLPGQDLDGKTDWSRFGLTAGK